MFMSIFPASLNIPLEMVLALNQKLTHIYFHWGWLTQNMICYRVESGPCLLLDIPDRLIHNNCILENIRQEIYAKKWSPGYCVQTALPVLLLSRCLKINFAFALPPNSAVKSSRRPRRILSTNTISLGSSIDFFLRVLWSISSPEFLFNLTPSFAPP